MASVDSESCTTRNIYLCEVQWSARSGLQQLFSDNRYEAMRVRKQHPPQIRLSKFAFATTLCARSVLLNSWCSNRRARVCPPARPLARSPDRPPVRSPTVDWSSVCPFDLAASDRHGHFGEVLVRGGLRSVAPGSTLGSAQDMISMLTQAAKLSEEEVAARKQCVVKMLRAVRGLACSDVDELFHISCSYP